MPILLVGRTQGLQDLHKAFMPFVWLIRGGHFASIRCDSQILISEQYLPTTSVLLLHMLDKTAYLDSASLHKLIYNREKFIVRFQNRFLISTFRNRLNCTFDRLYHLIVRYSLCRSSNLIITVVHLPQALSEQIPASAMLLAVVPMMIEEETVRPSLRFTGHCSLQKNLRKVPCSIKP